MESPSFLVTRNPSSLRSLPRKVPLSEYKQDLLPLSPQSWASSVIIQQCLSLSSRPCSCRAASPQASVRTCFWSELHHLFLEVSAAPPPGFCPRGPDGERVTGCKQVAGVSSRGGPTAVFPIDSAARSLLPAPSAFQAIV